MIKFNKIDTTLFTQKLYSRTISIESNIEEDLKLSHHRNKSLPDLIIIREAASIKNVDNLFNDPSIMKNNANFDFNVKSLDNVGFVKMNSMPAVGEHLTAKCHVDQTISKSVDESTLLWINQDKDFNIYHLTNITTFTLNTQAFHDSIVNTKSYEGQLNQENEQSRRDVRLKFCN